MQNQVEIDIKKNLVDLGDPFKITAENFSQFLGKMVSILLVFAALTFFAFFVISGFQYLTSGGDKAGIEAAKNRITYAFVGLFIVIIAWAVLRLITYFFGIEGVTS